MLKTLCTEVRQSNEEAKIYKEELKKAKERVAALEDSQNVILAELQCLREMNEDIDLDRRKNNLVLHNFNENKDETLSLLLDTFILFAAEKMQISVSKIEIDFIKRLGARRNDSPRPVLIRFISTWKKHEFLTSNFKLTDERIYFTKDLPLKMRKRRRELMPYLQMAREKQFRASLRRDKLLLNGRLYSLEQLHKSRILRKEENETTGEESTTVDGGPLVTTEDPRTPIKRKHMTSPQKMVSDKTKTALQ